MFRVMDIGPDGQPVVTEGNSNVKRPPAGTIRWIDLQGQDVEQLAILAREFEFHALTIEDCAHLDQRPKLEEYAGYAFIVTHSFACPSKDPRDVVLHEVHAFLGAGYIVTVHSDKCSPLEDAWDRAAGEAALGRRGADYLYYLIVDLLVDANFEILDLLADALEEIEDKILEGNAKFDLGHIFQLKRTLVTMRRTLSPQRDVFAILAKRGSDVISDKTAVYLRDVYDHLVRIYESIDTARDLLGNALDAHLNMLAQRTNEIMKRLTLMSAVFLPLAFVSGVFGMNFDDLPIGNTVLYWITVCSFFLIPGGMFVWFRQSKWL